MSADSEIKNGIYMEALSFNGHLPALVKNETEALLLPILYLSCSPQASQVYNLQKHWILTIKTYASEALNRRH